MVSERVECITSNKVDKDTTENRWEDSVYKLFRTSSSVNEYDITGSELGTLGDTSPSCLIDF